MLMPTTNNTKTVTDLREDTLEVLNLVGQKKQPVFLFRGSKPANVLMVPQDRYFETMELLEDYLEELEAIELEKEPKIGGVPLEALMKEYGLRPRKK